MEYDFGSQILKGERLRCQQIYDSHDRRTISIPGGCGMAAGFATYLGPYHHNFRRYQCNNITAVVECTLCKLGSTLDRVIPKIL